jgi:hypothetical protein
MRTSKSVLMIAAAFAAFGATHCALITQIDRDKLEVAGEGGQGVGGESAGGESAGGESAGGESAGGEGGALGGAGGESACQSAAGAAGDCG